MGTVKTPWGDVEVPDVVPCDATCGQCGRCCSGFVLTMRDMDMEIWYQRFLNHSEYEYPADIGALKHLFVKIPDAFSADCMPLHTCLAFDRKTKTCTIFESAPEIRPMACWIFPFQYDLDTLYQFPYPWCKMFQQTLLSLQHRFLLALVNYYHPLSGWAF